MKGNKSWTDFKSEYITSIETTFSNTFVIYFVELSFSFPHSWTFRCFSRSLMSDNIAFINDNYIKDALFDNHWSQWVHLEWTHKPLCHLNITPLRSWHLSLNGSSRPYTRTQTDYWALLSILLLLQESPNVDSLKLSCDLCDRYTVKKVNILWTAN